MRKKYRQQIFDKYNGKCAYCGCELTKGWHIDHIEPVRRTYKYDNKKKKYVLNKEDPYMHPERLCIENQNPACASCNINKHNGTIEEFRNLISGFRKHLNEINTQYKVSKRYGLIIEVDKPVVFYFENFINK